MLGFATDQLWSSCRLLVKATACWGEPQTNACRSSCLLALDRRSTQTSNVGCCFTFDARCTFCLSSPMYWLSLAAFKSSLTGSNAPRYLSLARTAANLLSPATHNSPATLLFSTSNKTFLVAKCRPIQKIVLERHVGPGRETPKTSKGCSLGRGLRSPATSSS